jgi:hypothetical protein
MKSCASENVRTIAHTLTLCHPFVLFFTDVFLYFCLVWLTLFADINMLWEL